jgi:lipoprotein signal peptidase
MVKQEMILIDRNEKWVKNGDSHHFMLLENQHGIGYGMLSTTKGVGYFLSSIVVGTLWTYISPGAGFLFGAVLSFSAAIILFLIHLPKNILHA